MATHSCYNGCVQHYPELCDTKADPQALCSRSVCIKYTAFHQCQIMTHACFGLSSNSTPGTNVCSLDINISGRTGLCCVQYQQQNVGCSPCAKAIMMNFVPDLRIYDMALLTYLIAFGHFTSEICFFRTAKINLPVLSPVIVSSMRPLLIFFL